MKSVYTSFNAFYCLECAYTRLFCRACTRAASSRQVLLHWGMHAVHAGRFKSSQATLRSPAEPSQPVLLSIAWYSVLVYNGTMCIADEMDINIPAILASCHSGA